MNTLYTKDNVKQVAESLLDHARSVYKYTASYCRDDEANARFNPKTRAYFRRHATNLVENLYAMMLLTRNNSISDFCNLEQVEAYYEAARDVLGERAGVVDYACLYN